MKEIYLQLMFVIPVNALIVSVIRFGVFGSNSLFTIYVSLGSIDVPRMSVCSSVCL